MRIKIKTNTFATIKANEMTKILLPNDVLSIDVRDTNVEIEISQKDIFQEEREQYFNAKQILF